MPVPRRTKVFTSVLAALVAAIAAAGADQGSGEHRSPNLSAFQFVGTHNSYHIEPPAPLFELMIETGYKESRAWPARKLVRALSFSHAPIEQQLSMGVRLFEFDMHDDPAGNRFSMPGAYQLLSLRGVNLGVDLDPGGTLSRPGIKVFHTADTDVRSHCLALVQCFQTIMDWSRANPAHLPVFIQLETKESRKPAILDAYQTAEAAPFEGASWDRLYAEILEVFPRNQILTPQDVQGASQSVNAAVRDGGWPSLDSVRGKIIFLLLDDESKQRDYIEHTRGAPSMRLIFPSISRRDPDTAWLRRDNPKSSDIARRVGEGFLVYTRADKHTQQARTSDFTRRDLALLSGAQLISTDFPVADSRYSDYSVTINGRYVGCNNAFSPRECLSYGSRAR